MSILIKFFRKIRQRLIKENRFSKYMLYAIGEIILVVIGILIALSINTWNEKEKNEKEARFQLSKLKDNLKSDKVNLKEAIASDSVSIENLVFCVDVLSNKIISTKERFIYHFQDIYNTNSFNPGRGAFEGLISSGKIELISDQELLDALFSYYNSEDHKSWDSAITDYSRNTIAPYLLNFDHVPNIRDEEGIAFKKFNSNDFSVPAKTINDYKDNLFIINALRFKIQLFEGQKIHYKDLQKEINILIHKIDQLTQIE